MLARFFVFLCAAFAVHGFNLGPSDVVFHLFTRTNPTTSQPLLPDPHAIALSSFSLTSRTVFTIHSYNESVSGNFNAFVVRGHLDSEDINVIAVDWSRASSLYSVGLSNAPQAGEIISRFVNILLDDFLYDVTNIRIIGVGLGGHVAGIAGRNSNGEIPHIVALDPSFVGWTHHPYKLNPDDADVVEVLHATAGVYGYDFPLGDLDFYPNGGTQQTGCGSDISCSHIYSYAFYAESLGDGANFVGTACENYEQAIKNVCTGARDVYFGGIQFKRGVSGIYTFPTRDFPPFAMG